jgi:hypothetical protein
VAIEGAPAVFGSIFYCFARLNLLPGTLNAGLFALGEYCY